MKLDMVLSLQGRQTYPDQEPEIIELVTEGTLEQVSGGWEISYEESPLTGLEGVRTTFFVQDGCVTLTRTGKLQSQMIFRQGIRHESLYQMEFGALMLSVCANRICWNLSDCGGTVDLQYQIEIEQSMAGMVEYHLTLHSKE